MIFRNYNIPVYIILVTHLFGLIGLSFDYTREFFLILTPYHLLLTSSLIFLVKFYKLRFYFSFLIIFSLGFFIEALGVEYDFIFGSYQYGDVLGFKYMNVPLIIALNWFLLVFSSRGLANSFFSNPIFQIFCATILMVLLDFFIEPVAINLGFWYWQSIDVPLLNYIMWFIISLIMQIIISKSSGSIPNRFAASIYFSQLLFFIILSNLLN